MIGMCKPLPRPAFRHTAAHTDRNWRGYVGRVGGSVRVVTSSRDVRVAPASQNRDREANEERAAGAALVEAEAIYRFCFVHSSTRSSALARFCKEFAMLNRRYPSPNAPKAVPDSAATPACSSNASASGFDFHQIGRAHV